MEKDKVKILVLGGTGAMGIHLINLLAMDDISVYVTSRQEKEDKGSIHFIKGDAHDKGFFETLMLNNYFDAIVDFMIYTQEEFQERLDTLLSMTAQYIFLSSARVYAESKFPIREESDRLLDICENQRYLTTDEYALVKARQEDMLNACKKKNWTIIRPYITYGEERMQLGVYEKEGWLYRALHDRSIVFSRDIANCITTLSYSYDVARCIKELLGKDTALGETYHITTAESIEWIKILEIYKRIIENKTGKTLKVAWVDSLYDLRINTPYYQAEYDRFYNRIFDNTKITGITGLNNFTTIQSGITKSLESFLEAPSFKSIDWGEEALKDKIVGEWTQLKEISGMKGKLKYLIYRCMPKRIVSLMEEVAKIMK